MVKTSRFSTTVRLKQLSSGGKVVQQAFKAMARATRRLGGAAFLLLLLLTIAAGPAIILTLQRRHSHHRRRRRLQGIMGGSQRGDRGGGGFLHRLDDPKTVKLKGYYKPGVYASNENRNANQFPPLHLQQHQPISSAVEFSSNNYNEGIPPQQPQQPPPQQQFQQPQIISQDNNNSNANNNKEIINNLNTNKNNNLVNNINNSIIINNNNTIKPYNINNILLTIKSFRYQGFFFIYNSQSNEFIILHNIPICDMGCVRIYRVASILAFALRKNFPERFPLPDNHDANVGGENSNVVGDLAFVISTGDVPRIHNYCLSPSSNYCSSVDFGPILQFGSVFVNADYMPSMIAMPQPVRPHMPCFDEWQLNGRVCMDLQPAKVSGGGGAVPEGGGDGGGGASFNGIQSFASGLVFGQELGLLNKPNYWNDLIPQIIWRGTDFVFLHTMFPKMRRPEYQRDIAPKEKTRVVGDDNKRWAINAAWEMGEQLQPRWRGVLLTSEAELEAEELREGGVPTLPWVNIKFASCNFDRKKVDAAENPDFVKLQSVGIKAIGEKVSMVDQARYRYHIDLGGGGGTSWTGTIEKLALPGVLFHHVTPTKDWFYDRLQPWVHYIPVNSDLTDLREKFEWAESHPVEAQNIAEAGTEFARWIGTPEGFSELYQQHLVAPLRAIINTYQPSPDASDAGKSVLEIVKEKGSPDYTVVSRCSGSYQYSCKDLNGQIPN